MSEDDVLFGYRLQLLDYAARTTVSEACRTFGVHRSTFYRWKRQVDRHGLEVLRPRERRRPKMPNQLPAMVEERIVAFAIAHPGLGPPAGRLRAWTREVGRDRRLAQRRLEGALPPRTQHPRQALGARSPATPPPTSRRATQAPSATSMSSGRASWSASTASTSADCAAPTARSGSSPRSTSPPRSPGPSSSSPSRATPPPARPASSPGAWPPTSRAPAGASSACSRTTATSSRATSPTRRTARARRQRPGERDLVALAKARDRRVIGDLVRCDHPEGNVLDALALDHARGALPLRVGIEQKRDHHRRLVRRTAMAIEAIGAIEPRQIHLLDRRQNKPREMALRQPLAKARGINNTWSRSQSMKF